MLLQGAQVTAGDAVRLQSATDIQLLASQGTQTTRTQSANRSGSIGLSLGQNSGVTVSGAAGRGEGQTTDIQHTPTRKLPPEVDSA